MRFWDGMGLGVVGRDVVVKGCAVECVWLEFGRGGWTPKRRRKGETENREEDKTADDEEKCIHKLGRVSLDALGRSERITETSGEDALPVVADEHDGARGLAGRRDGSCHDFTAVGYVSTKGRHGKIEVEGTHHLYSLYVDGWSP